MVFYELVQNFQFKRSYNKNKIFQIRGSGPVWIKYGIFRRIILKLCVSRLGESESGSFSAICVLEKIPLSDSPSRLTAKFQKNRTEAIFLRFPPPKTVHFIPLKLSYLLWAIVFENNFWYWQLVILNSVRSNKTHLAFDFKISKFGNPR